MMRQIEKALNVAMENNEGFQSDWIPEYAKYVNKGKGNPELLNKAQTYINQRGQTQPL